MFDLNKYLATTLINKWLSEGKNFLATRADGFVYPAWDEKDVYNRDDFVLCLDRHETNIARVVEALEKGFTYRGQLLTTEILLRYDEPVAAGTHEEMIELINTIYLRDYLNDATSIDLIDRTSGRAVSFLCDSSRLSTSGEVRGNVAFVVAEPRRFVIL